MRLLLIEFLLLSLLCQLLDSLEVFRVHVLLMKTFLAALSHGGIISSGCRIILRLVLSLTLLLRVCLLSLSGLEFLDPKQLGMLAFLLLDGLSDFLLIDSLHIQVGVRCANKFEVIGLLQPLSSPVCMLGGIDIGVRIEHPRRPKLGWRSTEGTSRLAWVHRWLV